MKQFTWENLLSMIELLSESHRLRLIENWLLKGFSHITIGSIRRFYGRNNKLRSLDKSREYREKDGLRISRC